MCNFGWKLLVIRNLWSDGSVHVTVSSRVPARQWPMRSVMDMLQQHCHSTIMVRVVLPRMSVCTLYRVHLESMNMACDFESIFDRVPCQLG